MKRKFSKYIELDSGKCIACWKCADACTSQVLGKMHVLWHKHIVFKNPDNCSGCGKCLKACQYGAISKIAEK